MKRNILNSVMALALLGTVAACKPKKEIVVAPPAAKVPVVDNSKMENLKLLQSKQFRFNTLAIKGKANLDIDGDANNVSMNIRMKNNEIIWVSVTAIAGIEVARAMITPDSIKILNRLKAEYIQKPFSYIYGFTNKQINFNTLQAVLTGNCVADFLNENADLQSVNGTWQLSGTNGDMAYKTLFNTLYKVAETNLNDVKAGQALRVIYENYQQINPGLFPNDVKINTMSGTKRIHVDFSFSKIDRDAILDFPFRVPKSYQVIN